MSNHTLEYYMKQDYPVEIRTIPEELGGGYSASIPYLSRMAFYADGDTVEEALETLEDVKRAVFADMINRGKKIPDAPPLPEQAAEEYSGRILLRISKDLHRDVAELAEKNGVSINQYLSNIVAQCTSAERCAEVVVRRMQSYMVPTQAQNEQRHGIIWTNADMAPRISSVNQFAKGYAA